TQPFSHTPANHPPDAQAAGATTTAATTATQYPGSLQSTAQQHAHHPGDAYNHPMQKNTPTHGEPETSSTAETNPPARPPIPPTTHAWQLPTHPNEDEPEHVPHQPTPRGEKKEGAEALWPLGWGKNRVRCFG